MTDLGLGDPLEDVNLLEDDDLEINYDVFQEPSIKNLESHLRSTREDLISELEERELQSTSHGKKISIGYRTGVSNYGEDLHIYRSNQDDDITSLLMGIEIVSPSMSSDAMQEDDLGYYRSLDKEHILTFTDNNKDHLSLTLRKGDEIRTYGYPSYTGSKQVSKISLESELEFMIEVLEYIKNNNTMNESRGSMQQNVIDTIK